MVQKHIFLGFCMIFAVEISVSQVKTSFSNSYVRKDIQISIQKSPIFPILGKKQIIPQDFYLQKSGFFCRQEIKFYQVTGLALKFRLGSVYECDRLEGKHDRRLLFNEPRAGERSP
jgi:hypothetical protein